MARARELRSLGASMRKLVIGTLAGVLVGLVPYVVASLLDAGARSKAKHTVSEAVTLSGALEAYRRDHGTYPPLTADIADLQAHLVPRYLPQVPTTSLTSGERLLVVVHDGRAAVVASGRYGFVVKNKQLATRPPW